MPAKKKTTTTTTTTTTTKKTDRKATVVKKTTIVKKGKAVKEKRGFRKLTGKPGSGIQMVTAVWKERPRPTNPLEYLKVDLEHRKRKELRFVHKVLTWPSFSEKGALRRWC